MKLILLRLASALLALLSVITAREVWRVTAGEGHAPSGLAVAALVVAILTSTAAIVAVIAPALWWASAVRRGQALRRSLVSAPALSAGRPSAALLVAAVVTYALICAHSIRAHGPVGDDEGAYLATAQEIRDAGGLLALITDLYSGRFAEANRHPLYLALLSLRPTLDAGRLLSAVIGGIALLVLSLGVSHRFGLATGVLFAVLLAANGAFCFAASLVACESLLVLITGLAWLLALPSGTSAAQQWTVGRAVILGLLLGAAYLTKGTATLLGGVFLAWMLLPVVVASSEPSSTDADRPHRHRRLIALRSAVLMLLAGVVIASPLLVRNVLRYGSPLHNVNSWLMFTDEYTDPVRLSESEPLGQLAREYLRTHSFGQLARRAATGVIWETYIMLRGLGPSPLDDSRILFGIPLALAAAVGLVGQGRSEILLLTLWTGSFLVFFGWYVPIAAGERFVLPLLVPLLASASHGLVRLLSLGFRHAPQTGRTVLCLGGILWCGIWTALTWLGV